jgi:hypothetical protein
MMGGPVFAPVARVRAAVAAALGLADDLEGGGRRGGSGLEPRLGAAHAGHRAGVGHRRGVAVATEADAARAVGAPAVLGSERHWLRSGGSLCDGGLRSAGRLGLGRRGGRARVAGRRRLRIGRLTLAAGARRRGGLALVLALPVLAAVAGRRSGLGRRVRRRDHRRRLGLRRVRRILLPAASLAPAAVVVVTVRVAVPVAVSVRLGLAPIWLPGQKARLVVGRPGPLVLLGLGSGDLARRTPREQDDSDRAEDRKTGQGAGCECPRLITQRVEGGHGYLFGRVRPELEGLFAPDSNFRPNLVPARESAQVPPRLSAQSRHAARDRRRRRTGGSVWPPSRARCRRSPG